MAKLEKERRLQLAGWLSWHKDPVLIVAIGIIFSLDQITKAVVRHSLLLYESVPRGGVVRITHTSNSGSAFGLFPDQTLFLILASFVGIAILLLVYRNHPLPSLPLRLALGIQLGGALGNLVDRVRMGQVTDFIDLGFWPVFNLADASIVIGLVILAGLFLFAGKEKAIPKGGVYPSYDGGGDQSGIAADPGETETRGRFQPGCLEDFADDLCPICGFAKKEVPGGWQCSGCGFKKRLEDRE